MPPPPALGLPGFIEQELLLGFRFGVFFMLPGGLPNPIDIRFQKVSGLSTEVKTTPLQEGGQNHYVHTLPDRIQNGNLKLERGLVLASPLNAQVDESLAQLQFQPTDVMVMLFSQDAIPVSAWMFMAAYPVQWSISDLDATQSNVVIDSLELAYTRMQVMRI